MVASMDSLISVYSGNCPSGLITNSIWSPEVMVKLKSSPETASSKIKQSEALELVIFDSSRELRICSEKFNVMLFPEGTPEEYVWKYAKVIDIPEEERHKYDNYDRRLDVEGAFTFSQHEFMKACDEMGITKELKERK